MPTTALATRPLPRLLCRLRDLGYLNCTFKYDELKDSCAHYRPDLDWLQYTWQQPHRAKAAAPGALPGASEEAPSAAADPRAPSGAGSSGAVSSADAVSWWLPGAVSGGGGGTGGSGSGGGGGGAGGGGGGGGSGGADPFDAEAFLRALSRLGRAPGAQHGAAPDKPDKPEEAVFVGDSTARQQTVRPTHSGPPDPSPHLIITSTSPLLPRGAHDGA